MTLHALTGHVVDAALEVHSELGPGLLESAYEQCLAHELEIRGFEVKRQPVLPVRYKGLELDAGYRLDLLVNERVVVELKAVRHLDDVHWAQLMSYLRLAEKNVGLLINFNTRRLKDGIKRIML